MSLEGNLLYVSPFVAGSVHDSTAWRATPMYENHAHRYFSVGEYVLGDSAYAATPNLLKPRVMNSVAENKVGGCEV